MAKAAITPGVKARATYELVAKSRRAEGFVLRDDFFRCDGEDASRHPLAELMGSRSGRPGGGRGGKTRALLYLSLLWVAGSTQSHSSHRPARFWAELLGMEDPEGLGARSVSSTWKELEGRGYVSIEPGQGGGDPPTITLRREDGTDSPYTRPAGNDGDTYRRIPDRAVQMLFPHPDFSGAALAMYLIAVRTADRAHKLESLTFPRGHIKTEYGFGETVRLHGLKALGPTGLGVLETKQAVTSRYGDETHRGWKRDVYDLFDIYGPPSLSADFQAKVRKRAATSISRAEDRSSTAPDLTPNDNPWGRSWSGPKDDVF